MSTAKSIAQIVPGMMALGLVGESLKTVKDIGKEKDKKVSPKKLVKLGITALVGVPMIKVVSTQVNALS
ncbi:hypothetical protein LCGC14_2328790 [marine sediment metagenome]|uniref:Uncharacterized protein n=1 Tax=marine sediment metagenome TaxID=412755 RepID=A0A0F9FAH5_9ZZZZ